jgi:hypothetical protein
MVDLNSEAKAEGEAKMNKDEATITNLTGGAYKPWLDCVECDSPSDMMLKRTYDKFAVPLCSKHYGNTEHIELTRDDVQGMYFIARDY